MSQYNRYCWLCVKSANVEEETCQVCHRSYHPTCKLAQVKHLPMWQKNLQCLQVLLAAKPSCWVCQHVTIFEHIYTHEDYEPMNLAIRLSIEKLMAVPESAAFRQFPDTKYNYAKFMVSPMYLQKMYLTALRDVANLNQTSTELRPYKSPEEFFYDLQLIVFNCKVANGPRAALFDCARTLFEVGAEEYCKLAYCYQCYLRNERDPDSHRTPHFLESCIRPHSLVWARHPPTGHYLPAKIVNLRDHRSFRDLDLVFFGSRDLLTRLPITECFAYSEQPPTALNNNSITANGDLNGDAKSDIENGLDLIDIDKEVRRYVEAIRRANQGPNEEGDGDYSTANCASVLERKGITVFRDRDTRLDETMLYMKDVGYHFCPITLPNTN